MKPYCFGLMGGGAACLYFAFLGYASARQEFFRERAKIRPRDMPRVHDNAFVELLVNRDTTLVRYRRIYLFLGVSMTAAGVVGLIIVSIF